MTLEKDYLGGQTRDRVVQEGIKHSVPVRQGVRGT
jgi:hypothetical protein